MIHPVRLEVDNVSKLMQCIDGNTEKKGRFFCLKCKKDHTKRLLSLPNDTKDYTFVCAGCGDVKFVSAGLLMFLMVRYKQALKKAGMI